MNILILLLNCIVGLFLAVLTTQVFKWIKKDYQKGKDWITTGLFCSLFSSLIGLLIGGFLIILLNIVPRSMHKAIESTFISTVGVMFYGGSVGLVFFTFLTMIRDVPADAKERFNNVRNTRKDDGATWIKRMQQLWTVFIK